MTLSHGYIAIVIVFNSLLSHSHYTIYIYIYILLYHFNEFAFTSYIYFFVDSIYTTPLSCGCLCCSCFAD